MSLPDITSSDVENLVDDASEAEEIGSGGQKRVFRVLLGGAPFALKVALVPPARPDDEPELADVARRAAREVEIMRECQTKHIVALGPVGLKFVELRGQQILYFTEELIEGEDLRGLLDRDGPLPADEVVAVGLAVGEAIGEIWSLGKIHRDIKPSNIMRRSGSGDYVLLDAGLAFDIVGPSMSAGLVVGTWPYFSPEQWHYDYRRTVLDFRSDIFALGVCLHEFVTGQHPFWSPGTARDEIRRRVEEDPPKPPDLNSQVPRLLEDVILRMLGKSPHQRYRKCAAMLEALRAIGD